jgi:hypothetical protein
MVDFGQISKRRGEFCPSRRYFSLVINQIAAVKMSGAEQNSSRAGEAR